MFRVRLIVAQILQLVFWVAQGQVRENSKFVFDRRYVGVAFSPYVKMWENEKLPPLNSYSFEEVKEMLQVISTRFTSVSTYGMGVDVYNLDKAWDETDSNCIIAKAAAEINREHGEIRIRLSQGIHQNDDPDVFHREIENAFISTAHANQVAPGTVWGITYTNQALVADKAGELADLISVGITRGRTLGIQIGVRSLNCDSVISQIPRNSAIRRLCTQLDYVMCNLHPTAKDVSGGPVKAAQIIGAKYLKIIAQFGTLLPNLTVLLGETGWPSVGKSHNGPAGISTIQNLYAYWTEMGKWAAENKLPIQLFEAFDEPWKSDYNISDPNQPGGRYGAEGHFGWWRRTKNDDIKAYVEKITEPDQKFDNDKTKSAAGLLISILVPLLVVVVVIIGFLFYRLKQARKIIEGLTEEEIKDFIEGTKILLNEHAETEVEEDINSRPYDHDYELPKHQIHIEEDVILGQGEFGTVFKGTIELCGTFEQVAFKTTRNSASVNQLKSLLSELKLMIYIGKHPNVIRLVGAYTEEIRSGLIYIAAEYCGKGSLENFLRKKSIYLDEHATHGTTGDNNYSNYVSEISMEFRTKESIGRGQMNTWALQIARGMKYLESKKIIHSDLATRNILLADDNSIRITDFGLSRRLYAYTSYVKASQEPLPWRWMAYESLRSLQFSSQSDVWSYGVTLWEIYAMGDIPYPGLGWDITFVDKLEQGLRMPCQKHATEMLYSKMLQCWELDPMARPTFLELEEFFMVLHDAI